MSDTFGLIAGGNINPSRFLNINDDYEVIQASAATDVLFGIAHDSAKLAPVDGLQANTLHAEEGDHVSFYKLGDSCLLELGGTVAAGQQVTSDANGAGVAATVAGSWVGAIALEAGVSGEFVRVQITHTRVPA